MIHEDVSNQFRAMSILAQAMIIGIVVFSAISIMVFYWQGRMISDETLSATLFLILLLSVLVFIFFDGKNLNNSLGKLKSSPLPVREKLEVFRKRLFIYLAICEFFAIAAIICFLIFGQFLFFIVAVLAVCEMIRQFPGKEKIEQMI